MKASNGWIYHPELGGCMQKIRLRINLVIFRKKGWLWTVKMPTPTSIPITHRMVYVASDQDTPTKAFDYNPKKWTLWQDLTLNRMVQPSPEKLSTSSADEKGIRNY